MYFMYFIFRKNFLTYHVGELITNKYSDFIEKNFI